MATRKQRALREQKLTHRQRRQGKRLKAKRDRQVVRAEQAMQTIDIPTPEIIHPHQRYGVDLVTNSPSMQDLVDDAVPARSKCPVCHFSHKVRKDGTMSRHDVYHGDQATQCEGTGQPWNASASGA